MRRTTYLAAAAAPSVAASLGAIGVLLARVDEGGPIQRAAVGVWAGGVALWPLALGVALQLSRRMPPRSYWRLAIATAFTSIAPPWLIATRLAAGEQGLVEIASSVADLYEYLIPASVAYVLAAWLGYRGVERLGGFED
jgi:hypothetical protein